MGYSGQYFYKQQKDKDLERSKQIQVKALVDKERKQLPRLGTRKIFHLIQPVLESQKVKIGRDKLFSLMSAYGLLIKLVRRYTQTTMSRHWLKKWPNIYKHELVKQPDQVWVSDITYLKTEEGNCYLNMVTDAFSRKILGYAVADNMGTESMIKALKMATAFKQNNLISTIHHSDRGIQYCSTEYHRLTAKNNIRLSMTENSDPYENALAERMNRTIKEEFGLDKKLKDRNQVYKLLEESIFLYNNKRPHLALKMKTPEEVYKTKISTS